jgi:uncharacterized paraquat-inducible protein A
MDHIQAHTHCMNHHKEILASTVCGCFYCEATFPSQEVLRWIDEREDEQQTAMCPRCGVDAVIGSQSGFPITGEFLARMKAHWF